MRKFKNAVSKGFDPDVHLVKVNGCKKYMQTDILID